MAGLDHRHLGIVRDKQSRCATEGLKRQQVALIMREERASLNRELNDQIAKALARLVDDER
ncbi:MAG: hypothetical protein AAAB35_12375 [Phyllobacterium sp.]|jgi:nitrate/nitrite-specific signal transduction histidine kinase|uniref:hypothetical protein n=1 Tax=Phyllobacterium sp. TaxID=1871046 RepID=UPI0013AFD738